MEHLQAAHYNSSGTLITSLSLGLSNDIDADDCNPSCCSGSLDIVPGTLLNSTISSVSLEDFNAAAESLNLATGEVRSVTALQILRKDNWIPLERTRVPADPYYLAGGQPPLKYSTVPADFFAAAYQTEHQISSIDFTPKDVCVLPDSANRATPAFTDLDFNFIQDD